MQTPATLGGFESICDSIVDDMSMAGRIKEFGYRGVFLDAKRVVRCRLYRGFSDAFQGVERSVYSALGGRLLPAFVVSLLVAGGIVAPVVAVAMSAARLTLPTGPMAVAAGLFAAQWALVCWDRDAPVLTFLLYPLVFADLVVILASSVLKTGLGPGVEWKGRLVHAPRPSGLRTTAARLAGLASRPGKAK